MKDEKFRKAMLNYLDTDEEITFLEDPAFDNSIVGVTQDKKLIYDYEKMIDELSQDEGMEPFEADDFISFDTLWAIGNFPNAPIILMDTKEEIIEKFGETENKEEQ